MLAVYYNELYECKRFMFMKNLTRKIRNTLVSLVLVVGVFMTAAPLAHAEASYSCGSYGASSYSENCGGTSKSKGGLSKSGQEILLYLLLSLILIAGGTALLLKTRRERAGKDRSSTKPGN